MSFYNRDPIALPLVYLFYLFVVVFVVLAAANFAAHSLRCFPGVTWPKAMSSRKKVVGAPKSVF